MESLNTDSSAVSSTTRQQDDVKGLIVLAHECINREDHQQALSLFQSALDKASSPTERLTCLMNAGACMVSLHQYAQGLELLQSALAIVNDKTPSGEKNGLATLQDNKSLHADLHYNMAVAGDGLKDSALTQTHLKQCIDCYIQMGKDEMAADIFVQLAKHYQGLGNHKEQITALLGAHRLVADGSDRKREAQVLIQLAFAYLHDKQTEECKSMVANTKLLALRLSDSDAPAKGKNMSHAILYYSDNQDDAYIPQNSIKSLTPDILIQWELYDLLGWLSKETAKSNLR